MISPVRAVPMNAPAPILLNAVNCVKSKSERAEHQVKTPFPMACKAEHPVSVTSFNAVHLLNAYSSILVNREQLDKSTSCKAEQLANP